MDDFAAHIKTVFKSSLFILSACFIGAVVLPGYRAYFYGFILGAAVSMINAQYLSWKIQQLSHALIHKTNRRINLGFLTRASLALLAILLSLKYEQIEFSTTLAGLFSVQLVTLLLGIISRMASKK